MRPATLTPLCLLALAACASDPPTSADAASDTARDVATDDGSFGTEPSPDGAAVDAPPVSSDLPSTMDVSSDGDSDPGGSFDAAPSPPDGSSFDAAPSPPDGAFSDVAPSPGPTGPSVFYAGGTGAERFNTALALSDGTLLLGGVADDLAWVPASVPRTTLSTPPIPGAPGGTRVPFVMQLSADLRTVLRVVQLPAGSAFEVRHLQVTSAPGAPTGTLYLSGTATESRSAGTGSFVMRLDGNFVTAPPTRAEWVRAWYATGTHRTSQPWDVSPDGRVVYAAGEPFGSNWAAVYRLRPDGTDDVVEDWRYHWAVRPDGSRTEGGWTPASSRRDVTAVQSAIVFKVGGRCDLRSWTMADWSARTPDGNGGTRQGSWPLDLLFNGPCDPANPTANGPGYTGYRMGANPTQQVGAIRIDRRSGDLYVGFSVQSRLPSGEPDFEPAVMAMTATGRLRWWSRLYTETARNSTPDQYVDRLDVDPSTGELVVLARSHGNNTDNLWSGNAVASRPGATAFHNTFTGTSGNIHISWLGRFAPTDGTLRASSWLAEYADDPRNTGAAYTDPNLDGWPSHNTGWPDLNTTRAEALAVDLRGRIAVIATGRRTITTRNAWMRMPLPAAGRSGWNDFVRVFAPDLSTVTYSSIVRSPWNPTMDGGDGNVKLMALIPRANGVLAVGYHLADTAGVTRGAALPTASVPAWGSETPRGESAVVAWLPW